MADIHESSEDLTRTGRALNNWYKVIFDNVPMSDCDDFEAMKELSEMKDTDNNRSILVIAASRLGLPVVDTMVLNQWVEADRVKSDKFPADMGFFSQKVRDLMATDIATAQ